MKHRELFSSEVYPPGRCIICDEQLPAKTGRRGAPATVRCRDAECRRAYWAIRRARLAELAEIGLASEAAE